MLVKQCKEEGIPLVNIGRKKEVVNSFRPAFKEDLLAAVKATEGTVAFDATGGGTLAMDSPTTFDASLRQLYPDQVHTADGRTMARTVYKYDGLDKRNSEFLPSFGVGNWSCVGSLNDEKEQLVSF